MKSWCPTSCRTVYVQILHMLYVKSQPGTWTTLRKVSSASLSQTSHVIFVIRRKCRSVVISFLFFKNNFWLLSLWHRNCLNYLIQIYFRDVTFGNEDWILSKNWVTAAPTLLRLENTYSRGLARAVCKAEHFVQGILFKSCMEPLLEINSGWNLNLVSEELLAFDFETEICNTVSIRSALCTEMYKTVFCREHMEQSLHCVERADVCHLAC